MTFHTIDGGKGILPTLSVEIDFTNAPTGATRTWTDITTDVRELTYSRSGRNDLLQRSSTGTLEMVLNNRSGNYDPENTSGAYYPGVKRLRWIRVRGQWNSVTYSRWTGVIQTIEQEWPASGKDATTRITAMDVLGVLNLYDLAGQTFPSAGAGGVGGGRAGTICSLAGLSSTVDTNTAVTCPAITTPLPEGSMALAQLQQLELSENGRLFADGDGVVNFEGHRFRWFNNSGISGTIGDASGEIPYREATMMRDDANIWNKISVIAGDGSGTAVASDATSQTDYYTRNLTVTTISNLSDDRNGLASTMLRFYRDPEGRLPPLRLLPQRNPSASWPAVLAANNGDQFVWRRRPLYGGTIEANGFVEQISETIAVDGVTWETTFQLLPVDDQVGWILGDAQFGLLGETTVLAW